MTTTKPEDIVSGYKFGWNDAEFKPVNTVHKGLSREVVAEIRAVVEIGIGSNPLQGMFQVLQHR